MLPNRPSHEFGIVGIKEFRVENSEWVHGDAWLMLPGKERKALDNLTMPSTTATSQMIQAIRQATYESEVSDTYR